MRPDSSLSNMPFDSKGDTPKCALYDALSSSFVSAANDGVDPALRAASSATPDPLKRDMNSYLVAAGGLMK